MLPTLTSHLFKFAPIMSLEAVSPKKQREVNEMTGKPFQIQKSGDSVIDTFRQRMLERSANGGFNGLRRVLRLMDENSDNKLTPQELADGCKLFQLDYSTADIEKLFKFLDRDRNGYVSLTEFIRGLRPEMSMRRKNLVLKAYGLLDINGDNTVTMGELKELYDATQHPQVIAGKKTVDEIIVEFAATWDKDGDNIVTQCEFMDYYADIGANIDNDDYFELMMRNAWHMSGGEGACRNTSCLRVLVTYKDGRSQVVEVKDDIRLNRKDDAAIIKKLEEQGVENIKKIETHA